MLNEYAKEEGDQQRKELSLGRKKDDEELLVEQIATRLNTDKKHNLMALFSTTSIMDDEELKTFLVKQHIGEVQWVANRFIDIYGRHIREIAFDHSVLFLGMLQHILQINKFLSNKKRPLEDLIRFALKQVRPLINQQLQTKEVLFPNELKLLKETLQDSNQKELSEQIQKGIEGLLKDGSAGSEAELLEFLAAELTSENPRISLIESVWKSLARLKTEAYEDILYPLWDFIEKSKYGQN